MAGGRPRFNDFLTSSSGPLEVPSQPTNLSIPTSTGCLDRCAEGIRSRPRPTLLGGAAAGLQKATAPPKPQARRTDPRPDVTSGDSSGERSPTATGKAACPAAVYVDLSSLRPAR